MEKAVNPLSGLSCLLPSTHPLKENPLFPLQLTHRWGEGVAEIESWVPGQLKGRASGHPREVCSSAAPPPTTAIVHG
jgi:hypothetical protein